MNMLERFENWRYLNDCKRKGLNSLQLQEVKLGFASEVPRQLVDFYAKPEFSVEQMQQIRHGFEKGLAVEQVHMFAKPELTTEQMQEVKKGFADGLSIEQAKVMSEAYTLGLLQEDVEIFAKPEFNVEQMQELVEACLGGIVDVYDLADPEFSVEQMQQIRCYHEDLPFLEDTTVAHATEAGLYLFVNPKLSVEQMRAIYHSFECGLSVEQVQVLANPEFDTEQMSEIRLGFDNGLSLEQVEVFAKPEFSVEQMQQIRCYTEDLPFVEDVTVAHNMEDGLYLFVNPKLSIEQMRFIYRSLEYGLPVEHTKIFAKPEFSVEQMQVIGNGLSEGYQLTVEQVEVYAKPEFDAEQMSEIRLGFDNGLSLEQVQVYAKPEFYEEQMFEIRQGIEKGLSIEEVSTFANPEFSVERMSMERALLHDAKESDANDIEIDFIGNDLVEDFEQGICLLPFTEEQIQVIKQGFGKGLSQEDVEIFAKPELNDQQMAVLMLGLADEGLSIEQAKTIAKPELTTEQIEDRKYGILSDVAKEQSVTISFSQKMVAQSEVGNGHNENTVCVSLPNDKYRTTKFGKDENGVDLDKRDCYINVPKEDVKSNLVKGEFKNHYMNLDKAEYKVYPKKQVKSVEDGVNIYDKPQPFMLSKEKLAGVFNEAKTIAKENKQRMQAKQKEVKKSKSQDMSR